MPISSLTPPTGNDSGIAGPASISGEEQARQSFVDLTHLPIQRTEVDDRTLWVACEMKAVYRMSVADAWVLATAIVNRSQLVHKDPDFELAKDFVRMLRLPYKSKK